MLTISRWSPLNELTGLHRQMDQVFGSGSNEASGQAIGNAWSPAADVTSHDDGWRVHLALPGVDPNDVTIDIHGTTLKIAGERKGATDGRTGPARSEICYGRFERTFALPTNIDGEKVSATYRHGILDVELPIAESAKPRRIEIRTGLQDVEVKPVS